MTEVFSTRLKSILDKRGVTQRQLAQQIGVTEVTVSRWANCVRTPDADNVREICKALDVSADFLLGLCDEEQNDIDGLKADLFRQIRQILYSVG